MTYPQELVPASLSDRFLARLIDGGVAVGALCLGGLLLRATENSAPEAFGAIVAVLAYGAAIVYEPVMLSATQGQTLGKRAMKVRVIKTTGELITTGTAVARWGVPTLASCLSCGLGGILFYLSPLFDSSVWRRGWHDQIAGTIVIKVA